MEKREIVKMLVELEMKIQEKCDKAAANGIEIYNLFEEVDIVKYYSLSRGKTAS